MKTIVRFIALTILGLIPLATVAQDDDLRVIQFDFEEDFYAEVELSIEPGDVSVLFNVKTSDAEDNVYLAQIFTIDGDSVFTLDDEASLIRFGFEPLTEDPGGQLGVFIPAAPDYELEPGDYIFVFEAEISTINEITAIVRSGDVDAPQAIDFNVWVLTDELLDDGAQESFAADIRQSMDETLNPHGMQVGEITFSVSDDSDYEAFAYPVITDEDARSLEEVCAAMGDAVGNDRALNVAIVEGFDEETEEGGTAGIAVGAGNAGIIMEASPFSCVVVSYEAYGEDFSNQAYNMLHEGGHFMSLPHTSESDGTVFDIFDDTPECDAEDFDNDGDGFVDDFECDIEGGANNLLFWSGEPEFAPYILSESQAWVLRRHPLFYSAGN